MQHRKKNLKFLKRSKKAVSPAISMVIITATTIVLILVTQNYAYQVLRRQEGSSEFSAVKRSFITFDDALRDASVHQYGTRSARFTITYGELILFPNDATYGLNLRVNVTDYENVSYSTRTGYVKYSISTDYITFTEGYQSYLFGNNSTLTTGSSQSYSRALITQDSSNVNIILTYGVKAMKTTTVNVVIGEQPATVSYIEIFITKIIISSYTSIVGDFDLKAKSTITTISYGGLDDYGYEVTNNQCNISVQLGNDSTSATIPITSDRVVFNFVIAEIQVST